VRAVQQATRTVPIVFAQVSDPVASGFVQSLARPGGNTKPRFVLSAATRILESVCPCIDPGT
jgi:hypothetical protein